MVTAVVYLYIHKCNAFLSSFIKITFLNGITYNINICQHKALIVALFLDTPTIFISEAVFGENPRYCHSLLVVHRRRAKTLSLALKSKCFHLQLWNFICICTLMSSTHHTHFGSLGQRSRSLWQAFAAEHGTRYAVLLFYIKTCCMNAITAVTLLLVSCQIGLIVLLVLYWRSLELVVVQYCPGQQKYSSDIVSLFYWMAIFSLNEY